MKIDRLDHVVFAVAETASAVEDWALAFDLQAEPPVRPDGANMELSFLPIGDNFMELVQATTPDHRVAAHVADLGEGMFSVSFEVADLDAAVRELQAKGVDISDPAVGPLPDTRVARMPRDACHGVAIMLLERKPN